MIEFIVEDRCVDCGVCIDVCPRDVFEAGAAGRPVIARADDCQTCFLCELYCEQDAIYVGPNCEQVEGVDPSAVAPLLGGYRRDSGWGSWAASVPNEHWRMGEIFIRARTLADSAKR